MRNVVRVNGSYRLIDLDASCQLGQPICAKFSSASLPPEAFATFDYSKYYPEIEAYWADTKVTNRALWNKLKPVKTKLPGPATGLAVKTFLMETDADANTRPVREGLPYALLLADPSFDIFSVGVMLFNLLAGRTLMQTNRDDDICSVEELTRIAGWTVEEASRKLEAIADEDARKLLLWMLHPTPSQRPHSVGAVLAHPFFRVHASGESTDPGVLEIMLQMQAQLVAVNARLGGLEVLQRAVLDRTAVIEGLSLGLLGELKRTEGVLLRGMLEAGDVVVPSTFIILARKLDASADESDVGGARAAR